MKILVICDQGNNRSVTLAGQLKYLGNDVLTVGIKTNEPETLSMLMKWADLIILTEASQYGSIEEALIDPPFLENCAHKTQLWDMGPDEHPRPYNREMLAIAKELIRGHPEVDNRAARATESSE